MEKVAFIIHALNIEHPYNIFGPEKELLRRVIGPEIMKDAIKHAEPFVYTYIDRIGSITGKEIGVLVILYPYLPIQLFKEDRKEVLGKLLKACKLAEQEGAKLVVLSSFTSMLGNEGKDIANKLNIAVTSGENYLVATILQGIKNAMDFMEIKNINTPAAILGATTNLGRICSEKLANVFDEIRLYSQNIKETDKLEERIKTKKKATRIIKTKNSKEAVKGAKVVLVTASPYTIKLDNSDIETGSIVCDASIPPQTAENLMNNRTDVLSFDGRFAEMKMKIENERWHRMFPRGVIFSRLAEGIILGLEDRFDNYTLGRDAITENKVDEITEMAKKHGFKTAEFRMGMEKFSTTYLNNVKTTYFNTSRS